MDTPPKTGAGGLRGVKTKGSLQRTGPKQQQKFRNALERWLVKPSKSQSTTDDCQSHDNVDMTDDDGFQSTSAQSLDSRDAEKSVLSDTDGETQPLTPQSLNQDCPVSPASVDSAGSGLIQTLSRTEDGLEKQEMERCSINSEGPAKHSTKITDFFSGASSQNLPVRRSMPDKSSEQQDADKETSSADIKWLGTPISELKRMPECRGVLPPLKNIPDQHTVLIKAGALFSFIYCTNHSPETVKASDLVTISEL